MKIIGGETRMGISGCFNPRHILGHKGPHKRINSRYKRRSMRKVLAATVRVLSYKHRGDY